MQLDDGQLIEYQWLKFYQQVLELPPTDRPSDEVIDDDIELDKWYRSYLQQAAAQASIAKGQNARVAAPAGSGVRTYAP